MSALLRFFRFSRFTKLQSKDIIIVVVGPWGAGKSSFINMATAGKEDAKTSISVGHNLKPCTSKITSVILSEVSPGSRIVLVDTPGFDDTDAVILTKLANWLKRTYIKDVKLAGIIYMHKISANRVTAGPPFQNLTMFKTLCGEHGLENVVLATSMWGQVEEEEGNEREADLRTGYWKGMLDAGSKTFRYERTEESARTIMQHFLPLYGFQLHQAPIALPRSSVPFQQELVEHNISLPETNVRSSS